MTDTHTARCVVVGASLAGLRAVEGLRRNGFTGEIVVVGEEPHMPYNRPPLSKGEPSHDDYAALAFRIGRALSDVTWMLGVEAVHADLDAQTLELANGSTLHWDGLIGATGLSPRRLPHLGTTGSRHALRTIEDAEDLFSKVRRHATLTVIGAGFVGCEVAAVARAMGASVDVIAPETVPMERALGRAVGSALQRRHERKGVAFHLGRTIAGADHATDTAMLMLDDGSAAPADVILEAIGARPRVEWLQGNTLDLDDGILADEFLRVDGRTNVFACGDVVRWPNRAFDEVPRRVEHWTTSAESGRAAGANLANAFLGIDESTAFAPVPSFWSDQFDVRIQSFGSPALADQQPSLVEGDWDGGFAAEYRRGEQLVGVVTVDLPERTAHYRDVVSHDLAARTKQHDMRTAASPSAP